MNRLRWLICALALGASLSGTDGARAAAQSLGRLTGTILDESGGAVAGASVVVTDGAGREHARTVSAADGSFAAEGLTSGTYRIDVARPRFGTVRAEATIGADAPPTALRIVLPIAGVSETVDIEAARVSPYIPDSATAGTRTPTPLDNIPQSVITVPRAMIEDQGSRSVADALRNVSNVTYVDQRDANNVTFRIRGFTSAMVVDGIAMPGYFPAQESLANVGRIDVLKGPSGALFGSSQGMGSFGTLGGTIAVTTSSPVPAPVRQVGLKLGSWGERGVTFDVNQPLGRTLAGRVVAEWSTSDSETTGVYLTRRALFPSLQWTPGPRTSLTVRGRYMDNSTLDYSGLPVAGTLDTRSFSVPRSTFIAASGLPETTNGSRGLNLQLSHGLTPAWTLSVLAAHTRAEVDQRGSWLVDAASPAGCFAFGTVQAAFNFMCGARLWDHFTTTTLSPAITGVLTAGAVRHTVTFCPSFPQSGKSTTSS